MTVDRDEIARAVALLVEPGSVVEVRAPRSRRGTLSGYFDDPGALVNAVAALNGEAPGVYITLNPVERVLLARAQNRIASYVKDTTSDPEVLARRWLLLDFDPTRPSGISSTDAEHIAAMDAARACRAWLVETLEFSPDSLVLADSGNGAHVLVRADLPHSTSATTLVRRCLEAVALYCGTDTVQVDMTVHNAARIVKLYGTVAAKGDPTPDRPHRLARILDAPSGVTPVPWPLLDRLASLRPEEPRGTQRSARGDFDVRAWLAGHGVQIVREKPWTNGATVLELGACPIGVHEHHRGEACVIVLASGMLLYTCLHNTCAGQGWSRLREQFDGPRPHHHAQRADNEPPWPDDADAPPPSRGAGREHAAAVTPEPLEVPGASSTGTGWQVLADVQPERVRWLWLNRIPLGKMTLLEGDPDEGKTLVAIDIAARVTRGWAMPEGGAGDAPVRGGVVYVTAEDGLADTIRPRFDAAGGDTTQVLVRPLDETPELTEAGLRTLEDAIQEIGAKLVVLDPLNAFLPDKVDTRTDHHIRRALKPLAALAERTGVAIVVIRHLNKSGGQNPKYRGGGSIGIFGAARASLLVAPDPNGASRKVLAVNKCNLGAPTQALGYQLIAAGEPAGVTARVTWLGLTNHRARDLLAEPEEPEERTRLDEAVETFGPLLKDGPVLVVEGRRHLRAAGISDRTADRARARLGVRALPDGYQGAWRWHPPAALQTPSGGETDETGDHGEIDHRKTRVDSQSRQGAQSRHGSVCVDDGETGQAQGGGTAQPSASEEEYL